ncbi:MAG: cytochrome c [Fimbriimonadales bacterium]
MRKAISLGLVVCLVLGVALAGGRPAPIEVVSHYERKCSSCHGKEGSGFDLNFEKKYSTESDLREMVASMPGAVGMDSQSVEAMVAYMRALSRGEPFIVWTRQTAQRLEGEVSSGTQISATVKRQAVRVERPTPTTWRLTLPEKARPSEVELTVRKGGKQVRLSLDRAPYSHTR